jgi:MerR HTH family regulatory protein
VSAEPVPEVTEDEAPERLTSGELIERTGITMRQITHWTESGLLFPEHEGGSGNGRSWPPEEVTVARRMVRLAAARLPLDWSAAFARNDWPMGELAPGITVSVTE